MPGFVVTQATVMTCLHGGTVQVTPAAGPPRATASGAAAVTAVDQLLVASCPNVPPCKRVQWANMSTRVLVNGVPVLLQFPAPAPPPVPGNGLCAPNPVLPQVLAIQLRAVGT